MSEAPQTEKSAKKSRSPIGMAIVAMIGIGLVAILYALLQAGSNDPSRHSPYKSFAKGQMNALRFVSNAPARVADPILTPEGTTTSLAAFEGKVTVVNFWASWCAPCIKELPSLAALHDTLKNDRFVVVPINVDLPQNQDKGRELLSKFGGSLPFYHDPTMASALNAGAANLPVTLIYSPDGRELARLVGGADWSSPDALAFLNKVLEDTAVNAG